MRDGESIAVNALSEVFADQGHQVELFCMNTSKHYRDMKEARKALSHYAQIHSVDVDNRVNLFGAFTNLFSKLPYHVSRLIDKRFETKLEQVLNANDYDIIQLETLFLSRYVDVIRKYSNCKIVVRCHNVEHLIWHRLAENTSSFFKKSYLSYQSAKLKQYEKKNINLVDLLLAVSQQDMTAFKMIGLKIPSEIVPIGLDLKKYQLKKPKKKTSDTFDLCFIGTLDWLPNQNGLLWFLEEVWPELSRKYPRGLRLYIAGRKAPYSIKSHSSSNVIIHGEVPDAVAFMKAYDVMIVPLFAGSGQRVKILEAMALGMPVITTSIGLEGIPVTDGKEVLMINDAAAFIRVTESILNHEIDMKTLGSKSRKFAIANFDQNSIGKQLIRTYQKILE